MGVKVNATASRILVRAALRRCRPRMSTKRVEHLVKKHGAEVAVAMRDAAEGVWLGIVETEK